MYREWECVQRNREYVYCVVIAKMHRERKESEREIGRVCVDCREIEGVYV